MSYHFVTPLMSLISCLDLMSLISCLELMQLISFLSIMSLSLASREKKGVKQRVYQRVQKMQFTESIGSESVNQVSFITCNSSHVTQLMSHHYITHLMSPISCLIITLHSLASRDKKRVKQRVYQRVQKREFTESIGSESVNHMFHHM